MPNINEMLINLEGFQYAKSINLNMGYYTIQIAEDASSFCMIIRPWGKYCQKHLPIGVSNSADIFEQKMNDLFQGFEFIRAYIYDLLIPKTTWTYHVQRLELTSNKLKKIGIKCNI